MALVEKLAVYAKTGATDVKKLVGEPANGAPCLKSTTM
jgi:hypothetical protein